MTLNGEIKQLESLLAAQPDVPDINVGDMISRQAAIDAIWTHATNILENSDYDLFFQDVYKMTHRHVAELIQNLPSAEPIKHGRWIFGETKGHSWMKCSECCVSQSGQTATFTYCPNCGADMRGRENDK